MLKHPIRQIATIFRFAIDRLQTAFIFSHMVLITFSEFTVRLPGNIPHERILPFVSRVSFARNQRRVLVQAKGAQWNPLVK